MDDSNSPAPPPRDLQPAEPWVQHNIATGGATAFGVQGGNIIIHGAASGPARPQPRGDRIRILMFAANPLSTPQLALDSEAREIEEKIRLSRDRDSFEIVTRWAVRPADLLRFLNEFRPHIVHFSGHGSHDGIVLSAGDGAAQTVSTAALAEMFRVMRDNIRVVMLNACYTASQAEAIGAHIDYIVGMRTSVADTSATVFAAAFYSALGYGRKVTEAFEQAVAAIMLHGLPGHDTPHLLARQDADPHLSTGR